MTPKAPQIKYDEEAKILSIRISHDKSVDSDVHGNVVMDYEKKGQLVNLDIMEVTLDEFKRAPVTKKKVMKMLAM